MNNTCSQFNAKFPWWKTGGAIISADCAPQKSLATHDLDRGKGWHANLAQLGHGMDLLEMQAAGCFDFSCDS